MRTNTQEAVLSAYIVSIGKRTPRDAAQDAAELCRLANSLSHLNEIACNSGLTERQERRKQNLQTQIKSVLERAGLVLNHFESDPRGYAVYLDLPDGSYNSFGGRECGPRGRVLSALLRCIQAVRMNEGSNQPTGAVACASAKGQPMKAKSDVAVDRFLAGYNCAQAVLYSFCDDLPFDKDAALRLATGFGAGMARKQEVCGAISGGILALGLKRGRGEGQDRALTEETYRKVRELMSRFESRHGSCLCRTLLNGCDLNTPEGQRYFKENNLLNATCVGCVKTVVETVEDIL